MYPISFEADHEAANRNRVTTLLRWLAVIPWAAVAGVLLLAAALCAIAAWFAILFSGRYPARLYELNVGALRAVARVGGFANLLTDRFPPFSGRPDDRYPIRLGAAPPKASYDRLKALLRLVLAIPVVLLAYVQGVIAAACSFAAWFAILFSGRLPEALFRAIRAAVAYQARATGYMLLLTEDYPPFGLEPTVARGAT